MFVVLAWSLASPLRAATVSSLHPPAVRAARPNIVLILADDLGYGDPGCYNSESKIPTPNIDRLAREGMRFTDAHSASSVCSPSRYSILTGRYAWRTWLQQGVLFYTDPPLIDANRLTLPEMLRRQGYATAAFGKWHLGWDWATRDGQPPQRSARRAWKSNVDFSRPIANGPTTRGFDYYFGVFGNSVLGSPLLENDRPLWTGAGAAPRIAGISPQLLAPWQDYNTLPVVTEKVLWYLRKQARTRPAKPLFVYFALTAPHKPIQPAPEFRGKTAHGEYCDYVSEVDAVVGRVLDTLKEAHLADNTLVLVSSDNGSPCYADNHSPTYSIQQRYGHDPSRPWRGMKGDIFEGGHHVPLVARWPGHVKPGSVCDQTVCLVDLMATTAAIVGRHLPPDAGEDSYNLLPALTGQPLHGPIREAIVHHSLTGMFAIRQGQWKLILGLGSGGFTMPQTIDPHPGDPLGQLYNLASDPQEATNLYQQHPEIVVRLTALLARYQHDGRSAPLAAAH